MNFDFLIETEIQGISIFKTTQNSDVLILVLDHQKNKWILTAHTVDTFSMNYMCLYNIIDRISILDETNTSEDELRKIIFSLLRGVDANKTEELEWKKINEILQKIRLSEFILLEIEPVSGAHILLIAKNISLQKID